VAGCCECGDEPSASGATDSVILTLLKHLLRFLSVCFPVLIIFLITCLFIFYFQFIAEDFKFLLSSVASFVASYSTYFWQNYGS
jgi:hypothetical protein